MAERLDIIVRLRDAARTGIRSVQTGISGIGKTARGAGSALGGMHKQLLAMAALFASGAFLGGALRTFAQFDDTMRQAGAVTNATAEQMVKMTNVAKEMGRTTRFTAAQAAGGLRLLGMAGFEATEATEALPGVLNLAAAGSLELSQAADIATNILAGFGLQVEDLDRVNDVLVNTFTSSNTTLSELGESFKLVGPIAKGVGADFEDLLASIGKLGDAGLKGTLAGTALRGALSALYNPTKEEAVLMGQLAKRIGVTSLQIKDAEGNFVGFSKIIEQLEDAGLKGEEALKLFGQRAGPGMAALLQVGSKELRRFAEEQRRSSGTARRIAEQMEAGIGGAMRELSASYESVKIALIGAFSEDAIELINKTRDSLKGLSDSIDSLKKDGTLELWAKSAEAILGFLGRRIEEIKTGFQEVAKLLVVIYAAASGEFDIAREALRDMGSDIDKLLVKRGVIESQYKRESDAITKQIRAIQKQIQVAKEKVAQDKEDIQGWRAKVVGVETYREQLNKHQAELIILEAKLDDLNRKKYQVDLKIKVEEIEAENYVDRWMLKAGRDLEEASSDSGPIGRGAKELKNKIENALIDTPSLEAKMKASLSSLGSTLALEAAKIESDYSAGIINLNEYFDQRIAIVQRRVQRELEILRYNESIETDVDKRLELQTKIEEKERQLQAAIIKLNMQKNEEVQRLSEERYRKDQEINELRLRAEKAFQDQKERISLQGEFGLEAGFQKELADLQERQNKELQAIRTFYSQKLQLLREQKATEAEILKTEEEKMTAVDEQQRLQAQEKTKLILDQEQRAAEARLQNIATVANGVSTIFEQVYELTGKKQKEWFRLAKVAAIAEATMNIALGITKAFAQGGFFGIAQAGILAAKGAVQIATIQSQSFAAGGLVPGKSPHKKSDDKTVNVTSGEYIHPVDTVKHYGLEFMEALRQRIVPRDFLRNLNFSMPSPKFGLSNFAEGGAVGKAIPASGDLRVKLDVTNNVPDSATINEGDSYYDHGMRQWVIGVVIDANERNVSGFKQNMGVR